VDGEGDGLTRSRSTRSRDYDGNGSRSPMEDGGASNGDVSSEPVMDLVDPEVQELGTRTALLILILIFLTSAGMMILVYFTMPQMSLEDKEMLKFPRTIEDAKVLGQVLSTYKEHHFSQVYIGFLATYVFLQTFAIPGSIFLSIISGFLFPFPLALVSVCFCSATGASFCYLLSFLVGRRLVLHYLPERAAQWKQKVDAQKGNILSYIIFLRITPFLPNWFINIVSPVLGVSLFPFYLGSFLGVGPPSFVFIQAGTALQQMTSTMDPITVSSVALLVLFALLSLLPVLLKNRIGKKFD